MKQPTAEYSKEAVFQEQGDERGAFIFAASTQAPWWAVSLLLHGLAITLCGLISLSINIPQEEGIVPLTIMDPPPEIRQVKHEPEHNPQALLPRATTTDENGPPAEREIFITDEMRQIAELSDHFETNNPEMEDHGQAFGNPLARIFYTSRGCDEPEGGGGKNGFGMDELIGIGGPGSLGEGGGFGGGKGKGIGVGEGDGRGQWGGRYGGRHTRIARQRGCTDITDNAKDLGLRWLAYHQEADGHWDAKKFGGLKVDTAVTGLALLAFLGSGHTEKVGPYKDNARRAVAWLKSKQSPDGLPFDTTDEGGHRGVGYPGAIATLALAEAAGMANIAETRAAAQKAVNYCTETHQQGEGSEKGGWRYAPKAVPDLSVTGWFIMALKSAKVAGLHVNPASLEGALKFLDSVEEKNAGQGSYGPASRYHYQPGGSVTKRTNAIGNLVRRFLGWKREDLQSSVEYFMKEGGVPDWGANGENVDLYYWYYGSLSVCLQNDKALWKQWNAGMVKSLLENQCRQGDDAGSWNPMGDYSGEWGRVGQTALSALCLEVYYRYDLLSN